MKKLTVLSLFDGMSCGRIALDNLGIECEYYASEIDKYAIKVSQENYPSIIRVGDVTKLSYKDGVLTGEYGNYNVGKIDLLIGGSPCQSLSNLGDGTGLDGKSSLFYHWLRLKNEINPEYFLLENVQGNKKGLEEITKAIGVPSVSFNSNLLSAQNRLRNYWSNLEYKLPESLDINLKDILDTNPSLDCVLSPGRTRWLLSDKGQQTVSKRYASINPIKASCLTARSDASWNSNYVTRDGELTKLTPEEYEKLQTVPIGYTKCVSASQRYKMLGNGWTVKVIEHILSSLVK